MLVHLVRDEILVLAKPALRRLRVPCDERLDRITRLFGACLRPLGLGNLPRLKIGLGLVEPDLGCSGRRDIFLRLA